MTVMTPVVRNVRILARTTVTQVSMTAVYRGGMALFMVSAVIVPVTSLLVWRAALSSGATLPVGKSYLTTYFVVLSFVSMATSSWMARFMAEDIRMGRLSSWLLRPASALHGYVANNLAEKLLKSAFLLPILGFLALAFAGSLSLPARPVVWLLFAASVVLGALLVFLIDLMIGALAFWLDDIAALDRGRTLLANILSGSVVPLDLAPPWTRNFVTVQPFRYTVSFPVELLCGRLDAGAVLLGFGLQGGYVVAFGMLARLVWSRGTRLYTGAGA